MSRKLLISFYAFLIAAPVLGQQAPQAKSPEEAEALQALFAARDPDTRIEVAKKILKKFKNTEFKDAVLYHATVSYEEKNDIVNMQIYGERTRSQSRPCSYAGGASLRDFSENAAV